MLICRRSVLFVTLFAVCCRYWLTHAPAVYSWAANAKLNAVIAVLVATSHIHLLLLTHHSPLTEWAVISCHTLAVASLMPLSSCRIFAANNWCGLGVPAALPELLVI